MPLHVTRKIFLLPLSPGYCEEKYGVSVKFCLQYDGIELASHDIDNAVKKYNDRTWGMGGYGFQVVEVGYCEVKVDGRVHKFESIDYLDDSTPRYLYGTELGPDELLHPDQVSYDGRPPKRVSDLFKGLGWKRAFRTVKGNHGVHLCEARPQDIIVPVNHPRYGLLRRKYVRVIMHTDGSLPSPWPWTEDE